MKGIEKARMGMIAVAAVMLVAITRRLMGARRFSSGMMMLVAAGMVLLVAAGGASADTIMSCGEVGTGSHVLGADLTCPADQACLVITADDVTIDGKGYTITGNVGTSNCIFGLGGGGTGESNPANHSAVVVNGDLFNPRKNVVIKNLMIEGFCTGIALKNAQYITVIDCDISNNGRGFHQSNTASTHGIHMVATQYCDITKNAIHGNKGTICGCGDGGNGIFTFGGDTFDWQGNDNSITYNHLYNNAKAGFHTKKQCANNIISHNDVTGNGAGGIVLRCMATDNTIVEYNYVADNLGAGIYFRADGNTLRYNTVINNKDGSQWATVCKVSDPVNAICDEGVGIEVQDGAANAQIYDNTVCDNDARDIEDRSGELTGDDNTCDTTSNYDDDGTMGCTFSCSPPEKPDLAITAKSETLTGSTFKVTYIVKNTGGGDAGASATGIYVGGTQVATDPVGALAAGATHEGTVVIDPFDCPCGTDVTVMVCADNENVVDESDETNNCRDDTFSCPLCAADPQLCANPEHNFGTVQPDQTEAWQFDVTNCGGAGTLTWAVSDNRDWITVSPTTGTDAGTVTVTINTAGLSDGTHTGTVTVESNGGTKTGTISVNVQTSPPAEVPTFTPIGMFAMVGLLGIVGMSAIRRR